MSIYAGSGLLWPSPFVTSLLCTRGRLILPSCITEMLLQSKEVASGSWQREGEGKDNPGFLFILHPSLPCPPTSSGSFPTRGSICCMSSAHFGSNFHLAMGTLLHLPLQAGSGFLQSLVTWLLQSSLLGSQLLYHIGNQFPLLVSVLEVMSGHWLATSKMSRQAMSWFR